MTSDDRYMQWYKSEIEAAAPLSLDEEGMCIERIRACTSLRCPLENDW